MEFDVDSDSDDSEDGRQESGSNMEPMFLSETNRSPPSSSCPDNVNEAMYVSPPLPYPDTDHNPHTDQTLSDKFLNQMASECEPISRSENCSLQNQDSRIQTGVMTNSQVSSGSSMLNQNTESQNVPTNGLTVEELKSKLLQHMEAKNLSSRLPAADKQNGELPKKDLISDDEIVVKEEILDFDYDLESEQKQFFPDSRLSVPRTAYSGYAKSSFPLSFHYRQMYNGDKTRRYFEPSIEDTDFEHFQQWYSKSFSDPKADTETDSAVTTKNGGLDCVVQMRQSGSREDNSTNCGRLKFI